MYIPGQIQMETALYDSMMPQSLYKKRELQSPMEYTEQYLQLFGVRIFTFS